MERLTQITDYCTVFCRMEDRKECAYWTGCVKMKCGDARIYDRLAAYEDTGLEPEQINHCKLALMGKSVAEITEFEGVPIERLKQLAKADKESRLVVLPCAPDATYWEMHGNIPAVSRFDGMCTIDENLDVLFYKNEGDIVRATDIGKTVFLTREEAERALAGGADHA